MHNILVSIVTPCFNSEKTIERTIQSVLNQTYSNIEYIIIDGKSTDHTFDIIHKYESKFNGRMQVVSEKDNGIYDAMNKGILAAKGQLIGIINSDDFYEIDAVENIVNAMTDDKYQIMYGMLRKIRDGKEIQVIMTNHQNMDEVMIPHPTCFITKALYQDLSVYDTQLKSCADLNFMLTMVRKREVIFVPVYKIIANFSEGIGMSSKSSSHIENLRVKRKFHIISKREYLLRRAMIECEKIIKRK